MGLNVMQDKGKKVLLMGNEAIARGALEAGVQLVASYPGTPGSEIGETLIEAARDGSFYAEWSTNEKVAFEVAAGASLTGARSLTAMKNAGINVAMDTFMTLPYGGCKGGFVVVVADDPDAHYSSTEQDTRLLASYAELPCLEPENQQEAKDMTAEAFRLSEELELPVFLRTVSRISHASGDVVLGELRERSNPVAFNKHYKLGSRWNVYGPPGCLSKHIWLKRQMEKAKPLSENSGFNRLTLKEGATVGIIASGLGAAYAREALAELGVENVHLMKLGMINPLPDVMIRELLEASQQVIVVEEGDAVVEKGVAAIAQNAGSKAKIYGKTLNPIFPVCGELNTDLLVQSLAAFFGLPLTGDPRERERAAAREAIIPRSSALCAGCSHLGSYAILREVLQKFPGTHIVNGDIGCYEQGGYGIFSAKQEANDADGKRYPRTSPYETLDTLYVMGSGIGMATGQSKVGYRDGKIIAVAGDSTFIHATLPAVVNAAYDHADITFLVFDNRWTCMTGHQPNPNTVYNPDGEDFPGFSIEAVCRAIGAPYVKTINAYDRENGVRVLTEAIAYEGLSVVVLVGECRLQLSRRSRKMPVKTRVDQTRCNGCKRCVQIGCPAIQYDAETRKSAIDTLNCTDCGLCRQYCPQKAIGEKGEGNDL